jgi:3-oxoacyl-(acyl-carrier-protein) synthase
MSARDDTQRVVVTGLGVNCCLGSDIPTYWSGLEAGRSGIGNWRSMDKRLECRVAGDMTGFDLEAWIAKQTPNIPAPLLHNLKRLLRANPLSARLTATSALEAMVAAGLPHASIAPERLANVLAGHNLQTAYLFENERIYVDDPEFIEPLFGMHVLDTDVLAVVSELVQAKGPGLMVGGACASGNLALITAMDLIRNGRADAAIVTGGAIAMEAVVIHGWALIEAVTYKSFNDAPARASRPFDALREGFVPAEGAAGVVLESLACAKKRGAPVLAELLGGASASDGSRLTRPAQEGQERAMRLALADARVNTTQIDYVNAHATSTPLGDAVEVAAIKQVLGDHAMKVPTNSTKSMIGHALTAAGVLEMVATVLQLEHQVVHPTINQEKKDPEIDLDVVPNTARKHAMKVALSNSFGFGGINSCVVVGPPP